MAQRGQRGQRPQQGQRPGAGGLGALLENESVQKELKLDQEQVDKVKGAIQKVQEKHRDDFAKLRGLPQDEQRAKRQELSRAVSTETLAAVSEILKPDQLKRLKQIELQESGAQAFNRPDVQKALNLKDEQKEQIKTLTESAARDTRELRQGGGGAGAREKMAAMRKQTLDKVQALLTDEQKKSWKELTGEPFELRATPRRRGGL
jgi:hypothetical protein